MTARRGEARRSAAEVFKIKVGDQRLVVVTLPGTQTPDDDVLTPAERAVAQLALSGMSNAAIARRRKCSVRTVANQLASVYRKLGVQSRSELAATWTVHGRK